MTNFKNDTKNGQDRRINYAKISQSKEIKYFKLLSFELIKNHSLKNTQSSSLLITKMSKNQLRLR